MAIKKLETVDIIASGYEWTCPHCDFLNKIIEIKPIVACLACFENFETDEHHAHE